jgi:hypothetical protein
MSNMSRSIMKVPRTHHDDSSLSGHAQSGYHAVKDVQIPIENEKHVIKCGLTCTKVWKNMY